MESNHISLTKEEIECANRLSDTNTRNESSLENQHFSTNKQGKDIISSSSFMIILYSKLLK